MRVHHDVLGNIGGLEIVHFCSKLGVRHHSDCGRWVGEKFVLVLVALLVLESRLPSGGEAGETFDVMKASNLDAVNGDVRRNVRVLILSWANGDSDARVFSWWRGGLASPFLLVGKAAGVPETTAAGLAPIPTLAIDIFVVVVVAFATASATTSAATLSTPAAATITAATLALRVSLLLRDHGLEVIELGLLVLHQLKHRDLSRLVRNRLASGRFFIIA